MLDQNGVANKTPTPSETFIKVPKKRYRKKLKSAWKEQKSNDTELDHSKFVHSCLKEPATSLLRNEEEFQNPTPHPLWYYKYNEETDGKTLDKQLKIEDHLSPDLH